MNHLLNRVLDGVQTRTARILFISRCKKILNSPPLKQGQSDFAIVSLLSHRDLIMYLCAVKSFGRHVLGKIFILNDGSLTADDTEILMYHLPGTEIIEARTVGAGSGPVGNCWNRLFFVVALSKNSYVIQLDSDTLTLGALPEVIDAIRQNRTFTLNSRTGKEIVPMPEVCEKMKQVESNHVQAVAERNFDRLKRYRDFRYVRGNAGFTGFAKGSVSIEPLKEFSHEMEAIIGSRWSEWGSDQVASNFMISNADSALVLPWPKYASFHPDLVPFEQSSFLHFIGTYRYKRGVYTKMAKSFTEQLTGANGT